MSTNMGVKRTFIADARLDHPEKEVAGEIVTLDGEDYYKVANYDSMPPFLMSIVSDSDLWMFISSSGGLTAGRKNSDHSLFPYYTDDKIHESIHSTGSKTIIRIQGKDLLSAWEPFSDNYSGLYHTQRNLYKSLTGNSIVFEELNDDLHLSACIKWMNSEQFGWVRETRIKNISDKDQSIQMLDGIMNILPSGILKSTQEAFSTLMDAYKKAEIQKQTNAGIFSLSSIPVDRPEPSEALAATVVWNTASEVTNTLLTTEQLNNFLYTGMIQSENTKKGVRCSYLIETNHELAPGEEIAYLIVADVDKDSADVNNLFLRLQNESNIQKAVKEDIKLGTKNLIKLVALGDGKQELSDKLVSARHFSNVLFNLMRGGIYDQEYGIEKQHLIKHISTFNIAISKAWKDWIDLLPQTSSYSDLLSKAWETKDVDLIRIVHEYLPIAFSRRHGDPSRPWNRFSINVKNPDGSRSLSYEGNWRDIFQNWEALSYSYPGFLPGIIAKFLNASTIDGYNPYRITSEGIDWEIFEPENPWSFIGYWGDHQIIYLLKLLELLDEIYPDELKRWLSTSFFAYGDVPYRIKSYKEIIKNPYDTIVFNEEQNAISLARASELGADGKLVTNSNGDIVHASLTEKLLLTLLTKLSNFIPEAGIWMNTQRPEWNDANNALVGNGVSMVTLYYLRRYLQFIISFYQKNTGSYQVSDTLLAFFNSISETFRQNTSILGKKVTNKDRKLIIDSLGQAGDRYRQAVYKNPESTPVSLSSQSIVSFSEHAIKYLDQSIECNKRTDGLYNAYNLINISDTEIGIEYLQPMLEGQAAVLSSGKLTPEEAVELLDILRKSKLFREDQQSYILYPDKPYQSFLEKNVIKDEAFSAYKGIQKLVDAGGCGILRKDNSGKIHFCIPFKNASVLEQELEKVQHDLAGFTDKDKSDVLKVYERLFNHHSFTGRSGSFFKYEGLGSIYWHMVSKLLLAVGENCTWARNAGSGEETIESLDFHYNMVKEGIGVHKNPVEYGAIPTDPYSHTPAMMGAQQPGMTGQVKEDIISRWMELGIVISNGQISIYPESISANEFGTSGEIQFTFCGTPFLYKLDNSKGIEIRTRDNAKIFSSSYTLDKETSSKIFNRTGEIKEIVVSI
ncbi:hypothetical protein ACFLT1_04670 [Bacteroidota bacterium]